MKISHREALKVLGLNGTCTFEEIKISYRRLSSYYHPDRNAAGLEMMKIINAAYQSLSDYESGSIKEEETIDNINLTEEMSVALNAIIGLGLTIEICGTWIWVSGDTRPYKDVLKENGYWWAPKKMMWHWRPLDYKSKSRGKYSMDEIRNVHGSVNVKGQRYQQIGIN